jgi:hypothetical protein
MKHFTGELLLSSRGNVTVFVADVFRLIPGSVTNLPVHRAGPTPPGPDARRRAQ